MAKKKVAGVKKTGNKQYEVDYIVTIDGKRAHLRATGFSSVTEAGEAIPALIEKKRKELCVSAATKTFNDLCREFEDYRSVKSKVQTVEALTYMIGKHILPSFDGIRIPEALTYERVSAWYKAKCASPRDSAPRKNKVFTTMRQLIECAWKWHYITSETYQDLSSLVENVRLPNKAKEAKAVWTYEDEERFLSAIPRDSIDYPMFSLFCYLGCRIGEFQGLQWRCYDAENGTITIGQQIVRMKGGTILSGELKTNESYRINQLDESTKNLLEAYRATLDSSEDNEYIFPSPYDSRTPLSRSEFRRRFNVYIKKSGVPKIVPHGVRHSKATMIASVCRNAEEVAVGAKFLGHSSAMFMGTYVAQNGISQSDILGRLKTR